jgi:hypothetical protein
MDGIKGNGGKYPPCQRSFTALHNQEGNPFLRGKKTKMNFSNCKGFGDVVGECQRIMSPDLSTFGNDNFGIGPIESFLCDNSSCVSNELCHPAKIQQPSC